MYDEYTLLTDATTIDNICDGKDLDDILNRFGYVDDLYINGIYFNNIKRGLEDDNA